MALVSTAHTCSLYMVTYRQRKSVEFRIILYCTQCSLLLNLAHVPICLTSKPIPLPIQIKERCHCDDLRLNTLQRADKALKQYHHIFLLLIILTYYYDYVLQKQFYKIYKGSFSKISYYYSRHLFAVIVHAKLNIL